MLSCCETSTKFQPTEATVDANNFIYLSLLHSDSLINIGYLPSVWCYWREFLIAWILSSNRIDKHPKHTLRNQPCFKSLPLSPVLTRLRTSIESHVESSWYPRLVANKNENPRWVTTRNVLVVLRKYQVLKKKQLVISFNNAIYRELSLSLQGVILPYPVAKSAFGACLWLTLRPFKEGPFSDPFLRRVFRRVESIESSSSVRTQYKC